jgi:hypothetical protein
MTGQVVDRAEILVVATEIKRPALTSEQQEHDGHAGHSVHV